MREILSFIVLVCCGTNAIYVPTNVDEKKTHNLGIKTIGWQQQNVITYQNYSNVKVQQHQNAKNLENIYEDNRNGKYLQQINKPSKHKVEKVENFYSGNKRFDRQVNIQFYSKCPAGQTGQFAYELNCNQYLNCWKGRGFAQNCAPGTLFNPKTLECDYADKVECISGLKKERLVLEVGDKAQAGCPMGFSGIIPHYKDCAKFIICNNGMENIMDCAPGTLFDVKSNMCDFPHRVSCVNGQNKDREQDLSFNKQHQVESGDSSNVWSQAGYSRVQTGHLNERETHYKAQDSFQQSQNGLRQGINWNAGSRNNYGGLQSSQQQVGISNQYNRNSGRNFEQTDQQSSSTNQYISNWGHKPNTHTQNVGFSSNNQKFGTQNGEFVTQSGGFSSQNVVRDNFYGSHGVDQNYTAPLENKQRPKCPEGLTGLHAHPFDCTKFLNCAHGTTYIQDCGPGTHFNPTTLVCDFPYNVKCQSGNNNQNRQYEDFTQGNSNRQNLNENKFSQQNQNVQQLSQEKGRNFDQQENKYGGLINRETLMQNENNNWGQQSFEQAQHNNENLNVEQNVDQTFPGNNNKYNHHNNQYPQNIPQFNHNAHQNKQEDTYIYDQTTYQTFETFEQVTPQILENFDGQESSARSKHWPPPFPSTDVNADYVFDYEDFTPKTGTDITLNPIYKNWCDSKGFECGDKMCLPPSNVCDGKKDCANGRDEIECDEALRHFKVTRNTKLAVHEIEKLSNVTLGWCAKYCNEKHIMNCKSFNYRKYDGTCFLLDNNVGISGALIILPNYDYYENTRYSVNCSGSYQCRNKKCLLKGQICDGKNDCGDGADEKNCDASVFGYKIKLAGADKNSGRIVIHAFGKTGFICDDMFGLRSADVACRELGFPLGALEVKGNSYFAQDLVENDTFYMMDDVSCLGNETTLRDCDFSGWGMHNCRNQEIVGVICKTPQKICPANHWKCNSGDECLPLAFVCDGVSDCTDLSDEDNTLCEAGIELRLANGTSRNEGRVEIKHHNMWGTICDDDFNDDAAKVICHQMGFTGNARVLKDGKYGPGTGPIWLDQVFCRGNESSINDCIHWDWGEHNCEHSEDVGIVCSDHDNSGKQRSIDKLELENGQSETLPTHCGFRSDAIFEEGSDVHFRVVQGSAAKKGDYPWQASIRVKGKSKAAHWCGAVIISQKFVLTAAHCLVGFTKGAYFVVAGDYNVDNVEGTEQEAFIEDFVIHEQFRNGTKMNNDIAIIRLKGRGFQFTKDVQAICLPDVDFAQEEGMNCTISGFGSIESGKSRASRDLRAGWIPIQPKEVCKMPHVYGSEITSGMLCAGSLDEGVDACDGDSGGPLACLHEGVFKLVGLTSWGQHCGYANKPGVYVRMAHYRNWVEKSMAKMQAV